MPGETIKIGKRGTVIIPAAMRRHLGMKEGALVIAEERDGGILIRPVEIYSPERKAELLLSNAVDAEDYAGAVAAVRAMGLDPDAIPHYRPPEE